MASSTNSLVLSDAQYEMVKNIIEIKELESLKWTECSIYDVPCNLREVNKEAYTPQLISIGPLHYGTEKLEPMQEHKKRLFHFFGERVSDEALKGYKGYLEFIEGDIRNCYVRSARKLPNKDKFVELILLDSVFIMEHMLRIHSLKSEYKFVNTDSKVFRSKHRDDYVLTQSWLSKSIHRDLLLLENQLPMFVLKKLYETVVDNKGPCECDRQPSFLDIAFQYFAIYDKSCSDDTKQKNLEGPKHFIESKDQRYLHELMKKVRELGEPKHFTDLIRYFYLPTNLDDWKHTPSGALRTVTKLQEAGVSFAKVVGNENLLDIKFNKEPIPSLFLCLGCLPFFKICKACLQIPQLKVDHTTECVLRNLIALEQCHYPLQPYICNYVSLIDSLIHTKDDVELLVEKEVIVHELGSDKEVATLVNGLCKHVVTHTTCYSEVIGESNKHYQNTWFHYMAALRLVYFRDPWRASSTIVGIFVLLFTVLNFFRVVRFIF